MYVSPESRDAYLRIYERDLIAALARIAAAIPAEDLSIQFDVCQEVLIFENYFPERPEDYKAPIFAELGRLGNAVPPGGRARLSPVLRLAGRRASGAADRHGHPGRADERHRPRGAAAARFPACTGAQAAHRPGLCRAAGALAAPAGDAALYGPAASRR
ncbi:MAG: hypothetical protein WDO24_27155 [Pseudomonadota bacterium]